MYLDYNEFKDFGGAEIGAAAFSRAEYRAEKCIDRLTFGRVQGENPARTAVKRLMFEMVTLYHQADEAQQHADVGIASMSNDGVSVSYRSADETGKAIERRASNLAREMLAFETTADGTRLLWTGVASGWEGDTL